MRTLLPLILLACGSPAAQDDEPNDTSTPGCDYPAATEPMALNAVIPDYSWAQALLADGTTQALDLGRAFCDTDTSYDWSPHDYMLFVSVPAW